MLPTLCLFIDGILKDRIVGFAEFGGKDDFDTLLLARRLVKSKMMQPKNQLEKGFTLKRAQQDEDNSDSDQ